MAGFEAITKINRHDFGLCWNDAMGKGGVVVGNDVYITIDAEDDYGLKKRRWFS